MTAMPRHRAMGGRAVRRVAVVLARAAAVAAGGVVGAGGTPGSTGTAKEACVEETGLMRRNHMDLLQHHRDRAVKDGIRTTRHSLEGCVNCHADKDTGSVLGRNTAGREGFCAECHSYVAVRTDCFECHTPKRSPGLAATGRTAGEGAPR